MSGLDASAELDEPVVESIELVSRRETILDELTAELVERVGNSRSTIDRSIRALEQMDWVGRTREGWEATAVGRLALERYRQFLAEEQTVLDAVDVLSGLPESQHFRRLCAKGAPPSASSQHTDCSTSWRPSCARPTDIGRSVPKLSILARCVSVIG
jgi:hypothetical protein